MIINYKTNQEKNKIKFCSQSNKDFIVSDLKKLISDKKILFLYDKNIDKLLIRQILDNLKLSGCKVFIMANNRQLELV